MLRRIPGQKGFTLIEISAVIVIIGLLSIPAHNLLSEFRSQRAIDETIDGFNTIGEGLYLYRSKNSAWPGNMTALINSRVVPILNNVNGWGFEYSLATSSNGIIIRTRALDLRTARSVANHFSNISTVDDRSFIVSIGLGIPGLETSHEQLYALDGSRPLDGDMNANNFDLRNIDQLQSRSVVTSSLRVNGRSTFTDEAVFQEATVDELSANRLSVSGTSTLNGNVTANNNIVVGNNAAINNDLTVSNRILALGETRVSTLVLSPRSINQSCIRNQIAIDSNNTILVCDPRSSRFVAYSGFGDALSGPNGWADLPGGMRLHWGQTGILPANQSRLFRPSGMARRRCVSAVVSFTYTQSDLKADELSSTAYCSANTAIRIQNYDNRSTRLHYWVISEAI